MNVTKFGQIIPSHVSDRLHLLGFQFESAKNLYLGTPEPVMRAEILQALGKYFESAINRPGFSFVLEDVKFYNYSTTIAPPVAAGCVDTLERYMPFGCEGGGMRVAKDGDYVEYTDAIAWGAKQREAGYHEGVEQLRYERDNLLKLATRRREWAEKAEARVKELEARFLTIPHHPV